MTKVDILTTSLNILHNYASPKVYLTKFLDTSAKPFFSYICRSISK